MNMLWFKPAAWTIKSSATAEKNGLPGNASCASYPCKCAFIFLMYNLPKMDLAFFPSQRTIIQFSTHFSPTGMVWAMKVTCCNENIVKIAFSPSSIFLHEISMCNEKFLFLVRSPERRKYAEKYEWYALVFFCFGFYPKCNFAFTAGPTTDVWGRVVRHVSDDMNREMLFMHCYNMCLCNVVFYSSDAHIFFY